ncbi:hypothetical protein M2138_000776 [Dysgonomonadaceae bacterium PH5-43]|nr:hypothetical protein [Dysgonomonadaceae bacterium PH5-43]
MVKCFLQIKYYLCLLLLFVPSLSQAETVQYPSLTQPGVASISESNDGWVLSNDLFSVSFIYKDGKLLFGGSSEMSLDKNTEIFQIALGDGTLLNASQLEWEGAEAVSLMGDDNATKYSERLNGKALNARMFYGDLTLRWRAVLRDNSHYLRTELEISTTENTPMMSITPMIYKVINEGKDAPTVVGNTRGAVVASDYLFAGVETPLAFNMVSSTYNPNFSIISWTPSSWLETMESLPSNIKSLGFNQSEIAVSQGNVNITSAGTWTFKFQYKSGNHRLNVVGVDVLDASGDVVASDYHVGYSGNAASKNSYTINIPQAGDYTLRYFGETKTEAINSSGEIVVTKPNTDAAITHIPNTEKDAFTNIMGRWSRNTTLQTTDTFKVSTVIGMVAEGQQRRSFLSYHERERAVPWRSFPVYNSWYELNINRNNDSNPLNRMVESQCLPVLDAWKTNLYDAHGVSVNSFVWDDGWDNFNSLWDFHVGFPEGFANLDTKATEQGSGIGAWLGPVGGYGASKSQRLSYWNATYSQNISNFELSNKVYFDAFTNRCSQMVNDYDMRYFKFDGISDFFSATGPKNEEDAEGIINVINVLRNKRKDLFFNCTVGTWASPFWFKYTDAVWRQENDFDQIGDQGNAREKWITYRDRLVYQNFVTNSPLCPINSLMTHGLIVTKYGPPAAMARTNTKATYKEIVREMRCAFACGSSMVELYVDYDLMNTIGGNKVLWKDLAECITWHKNNADVLADVHWVGGNPWDGSKANVYGWASWNENKSTLALRNPSSKAVTFTTTLRKALDIPAYVTGNILLTDAFGSQTQYEGITNKVLDIDKELTFNLPAFDVVVFDGKPSDIIDNIDNNISKSKSIVYGNGKTIEFDNVTIGSTIQVIDVKGSIVKNIKATMSSFTLSVSQSGVYVVKIIDNSEDMEINKVICL